MKAWKYISDENSKYLGQVEFEDAKGEWQNFEVVLTADKKHILFGGACNVGIIQSGYIEIEEGESVDEAMQEMLSDLEVYYNDGRAYVSRIVCNERM